MLQRDMYMHFEDALQAERSLTNCIQSGAALLSSRRPSGTEDTSHGGVIALAPFRSLTNAACQAHWQSPLTALQVEGSPPGCPG